jgi:hypothetical protein
MTLCLPPTEHLSGKLSDYGVTVPCSTDFRGRFLSHVVSSPAAASTESVGVDRSPIAPSHSSHRVARSPLQLKVSPARRHFLYFNVTVFGKELHLRLRPNRRLVVPGASVEWQEDFQKVFWQPLQQECVYTGGVTGMPGAAVAISNCDGLVRDLTHSLKLQALPSVPHSCGALLGLVCLRAWYAVGPVQGCAAFQRGYHMRWPATSTRWV